ncbi:MAG: phenylacetate--CoA ligase family protein [Treponema sp.]|nr:phenylacetate--CoA ligase family protein [Treponema sp.]
MGLLGKMIKTHKGDRWSREKIAEVQKKRLNALVKMVKEKSPFYKKLYADVGEDFSLSDLPPVSKPELMSQFDEVLTDRNITMERIENFTQNLDNIGRMIDDKYLIFKTSGSTGNPAVVLYDKNNIDVSSAVAAFRTFARKEDFRKFIKHGKKTAGVFADYGFYLACGMSRYLQLKMPRQKAKITVDVNGPESEIIKQLNDFDPAMLSGYPSNLSLLADFKELNIQPDVVITGGELLTDDIRKKLHDKFGCYVQTHYSCTEGGEIACECEEKHLHINEDWIIVEPVDSNNQPVPCGKMSDKVLITNLSNYIQPFIRYELTDRVVVHNEKCKCGRTTLWLEIEGRTDDILEFENGVRIAPMSLYKVLEEVKAIRRFQLIQRAVDMVELRMISDNPKEAFDQAKHDLEDFFKSKDLSVKIVLSDSAPEANKVSGKFKHIYKDFD